MNPIGIRVWIATFCLILTALVSQTTRAQTDGYLTDSNTRGLAPGNSFQPSDIDYINLGNGALNLHIPLLERKGRGIDSRAFVTYSSKIWAVSPAWDGILPHTLDYVYWRNTTESQLPRVSFGVVGAGASGSVNVPGAGVLMYNTDGKDCIKNNVEYVDIVDYGFTFVTPDGTAYRFPNRHVTSTPPGFPRCVTSTGNIDVGYSDNATFELDTGTTPYIVHYKDGSTKTTNGPYKDTNGNFFDSNGDTLKRTISVTGFAADTLTVVDSNGNSQTYTLQTTGTASSTTQFPTTSCGSVPIHQYTESMGGTTTLTLPSGRTYIFAYDPNFNEVTKVTLPTGGYVRYQYVTIANWDNGPYFTGSCATSLDSRRISARFVSPDGNPQHEQQWQYSYTYSDAFQLQTTVTDPLGNVTVHSFGAPNGTVDRMHETLTQYYDNAGHLFRTVANAWAGERLGVQTPMSGLTACDTGNWRLTSTSNTVADTNQVKNVQTNFDSLNYTDDFNCGINGTITTSRGNVLSTLEYDWGNSSAGPLLRRTVYTYLHDSNSNYLNKHILDRVTSKTVYDSTANQCQGQARACAQTTYGYDTTTIATKSGVVQHDYTNYPSTMIYRGNPTTISRWRNTDGVWLTTTNYYDELGNLIQTTDPLSHNTYFDYTDSWSGTACIPSGGTGTAFVTKVTNPLSQFTTTKYYPCSSLAASTTDLNSLTTSFTYDSLERLTLKTFPDGGQVATNYNDVPPVSVTTTSKINPSQNLITTKISDGLGRVIQTQLSDRQGTVYTDTVYDALGRIFTVSNPYRSGTDITTSSGTTTYAYDALSRKITETYPDSSVLQTAYCGPSTLVTDPTGKWRRSRTDALDRLVEVDEANAPGATVASTGCPGTGEPIWVTSYTYDTLGNLTQVLQNGSHQRNFTYDSLSRLLTSTNPEVGTIAYKYDSDTNCSSPNSFIGLLVSKTDARGIRTCAQYDALNRETVRNYSNGDPTITTIYDQTACLGLPTCQNIGHRTSMTDAAGSEAWSYQVDAANSRSVHVDQRTNISSPNNITKTSTYFLDQAGNVTQVAYPAGRIVNYSYDSANRPSTAADGSNGITYATGFTTSPGGTCLNGVTCYTPQGTFYALSIGQSSSLTNGLNLTHVYNSRLQPNEFKASSTGGNAIDITYGFVDPSTSHNAGHVYSITNNLDSTRSQNFTYDQLNRITSALTTSTYATSPTHCWGETYQFDGVTNGAWGNLTQIAATTNSAYVGCTQESGFSSSADGNNHLSAFSYDLSGNTQNDGTFTYNWDAESQLKSAGGVTYAYDGDGRRVAKVGSKLYWYGSGGDILAETDSSGNTTAEYIFFGGKRIAMLSVGSVDVRFTNDSCSGCGGNPVGGGDRNLFINSVTIDSTSIPPNDPSVSYVTPPCNEYANGVGQLLCNGDMIVNKSLGAPGQTITVNAYGSTDYNIYPHMQLLLNGVILGEWDVTGSGQNYSVTIPSSSILYYGEDLLGTSRVITTNTGVVCYDADFYPYGGERPYTNTCPQNYKFEGKERDSETSIGPGNTNGNDDFGARYYSNRFGRWLSADWSAVPVAVPYANLTNPQTLNLYAMVADDPESFADLDGHTCDQQSGKGCFWQKLWHGLMGVGFRTNTEVANAATTARKNLEGKGTLNSDSGEVKIYSKDDLAKMSDRQVLLLQDELNGLAKNGITQDQINAINAIVMTQWGWSGTKPYRDAMNQLKQAGTHENLGGKVPTREEATRMIRESGGLVERQDPGHTPGGVSTHTEPHINYTTASGEKATVIVRE